MFGDIFPFLGGTTHNTIISSPKEGDILHMHIHGTTPKSSPKGGGCMCLKCVPPPGDGGFSLGLFLLIYTKVDCSSPYSD